MGNGTILQYKALKTRGKSHGRKSNGKQWQKAMEAMKRTGPDSIKD
jgi:hypothetical protein